jgi:LAO/AO transport system kinase
LLSLIEAEDPAGQLGLMALYPYTGRAHLVGVTGAPGTGKSTLVNQIALELRKPASDRLADAGRVGVIAVDPSSPFTGGAILGDRIRMREVAQDPAVFIRSMATRGELGGLAPTTGSMAQALDGAGFGHVLIETVGAGQAEVEIARMAQSTVVVEAPGMGDEIQAIKAGILEAADIVVVNKADLPGAEETVRALRTAINLGHPGAGRGGNADPMWVPPVLRTTATTGEGVPDVVEALARHYRHLRETGMLLVRERERARREISARLREQLLARFLRRKGNGTLEDLVEQVAGRRLSPQAAVDQMLDEAGA